MNTLITALLQASAAMQNLAGESTNSRTVSQLVMLQMALVDLAQQLRDGRISAPAPFVDDCLREVDEVRKAALDASGSKDEGKYALVVVEGREALLCIQRHAIRANAMDSARGSAYASTLSGGYSPFPPVGGPTPFPWPHPHPFPWPPRPWPPFPPRPWPIPGPWDPDVYGLLEAFGYPGAIRR